MIVIFEYFSKLWILSLIEIGTDVPLTRFQKKREMEAISKRSRLLETTNPESGSVFEIFNIFWRKSEEIEIDEVGRVNYESFSAERNLV